MTHQNKPHSLGYIITKIEAGRLKQEKIWQGQDSFLVDIDSKTLRVTRDSSRKHYTVEPETPSDQLCAAIDACPEIKSELGYSEATLGQVLRFIQRAIKTVKTQIPATTVTAVEKHQTTARTFVEVTTQAQPKALPLGHYEARDVIGLLRTGHLERQHPWTNHGAMQRLTVEMHQPAWQVRLEKYVTPGRKHTDSDAISYGIVPTARTRASAADPTAFDQLFNLIGGYYNDLRTSKALVNGHLNEKQAASLLSMIESASREQGMGRNVA